jgi:hypothetical protein
MFAAYVTPDGGRALIDRELYLPEKWTPTKTGRDLIPLTAGEARRLFNLYTRASHPDAFHEHWSRWRRYRQTAARKSHYARRTGQGHDRRSWVNAIYVPRRRSLRWRVVRRRDAAPLSSGSAGHPLSAQAFAIRASATGLGHSRRISLEYDVRTSDRHRDRAPRIARDIAPLPRACARLEPEGAIQPQGTDRSHMRAAVLVDRGQPGRTAASMVLPRSRLNRRARPPRRTRTGRGPDRGLRPAPAPRRLPGGAVRADGRATPPFRA